MKRFLLFLWIFPFFVLPAKADIIRWVDFNVP